MTKKCRACGQEVLWAMSRRGTPYLTNLNHVVHMCQEYLDNLRNKVAGYKMPWNWAYIPLTPAHFYRGLHYRA